MSDDKFDKHFNLETTEYREESRPEPFFGYAGKATLIMFLLGFPIVAGATFLVTGEFPYWVPPLAEWLAGLVGWPLAYAALAAPALAAVYFIVLGIFDTSR